MKWLDNLTGSYSSSAKVVNDTLILSLPDAVSPVVWRMELQNIKAAAFEMQQQENNHFMLVMRTAKGETQEIAPFENRAKALRALMSASQAMEQAQTMAQSAANDKGAVIAPAPKSKSNPMISLLVGLVILAALLFGMTKIGPRSSSSLGTVSAQATDTNTGGNATQPGKPMSADDFLRAR